MRPDLRKFIRVEDTQTPGAVARACQRNALIPIGITPVSKLRIQRQLVIGGTSMPLPSRKLSRQEGIDFNRAQWGRFVDNRAALGSLNLQRYEQSSKSHGCGSARRGRVR